MTSLVFGLTACSGTPEYIQRDESHFALERHEPLPVPTFDYRVGPGDVLRVLVFRHPELSSQPYRGASIGTPVDSSGSIVMPPVGAISVSGKTVFEIREALTTRLAEYLKRPEVDVAVLEFGSQRVYIMGEVKQPGMFVLDRPITAIQALAMSGGFTNYANREQVVLIRGEIRPENMMFFSADDLDPAAGIPVRAGDVLFVGRRAWAGVAQAAQDLVPILHAISLPVSTARDIAIFSDIRSN